MGHESLAEFTLLLCATYISSYSVCVYVYVCMRITVCTYTNAHVHTHIQSLMVELLNTITSVIRLRWSSNVLNADNLYHWCCS